MKTTEELLMEFIAKYASHWIGAEEDISKDLDTIISTLQKHDRPEVDVEEIEKQIDRFRELLDVLSGAAATAMILTSKHERADERNKAKSAKSRLIGLFKAALHHRPEAKVDEGWIDPEKSLPETRPAEECYGQYAMSVDVLVIDDEGHQFTAYYNYTMAGDPICINPWEECFTECPFGEESKIIGWQPLPEPPTALINGGNE